MEDLFQDFDASDLLDKVNELVEHDKPTKFVIPLIRHHKRVLESTRNCYSEAVSHITVAWRLLERLHTCSSMKSETAP